MVTLAAGWERKRGAREEAGAPERGAGVQEGGDDGLSLGRDSVQGENQRPENLEVGRAGGWSADRQCPGTAG